jgi:hypothetical protein
LREQLKKSNSKQISAVTKRETPLIICAFVVLLTRSPDFFVSQHRSYFVFLFVHLAEVHKIFSENGRANCGVTVHQDDFQPISLQLSINDVVGYFELFTDGGSL